MKLCSGFVSNSSTASFILLSPRISIEEVERIIGIIELTAKAIREHHNVSEGEMFGEAVLVKKDGDPYDWGNADYEYFREATRAKKGDILINGKGDNSIPYEIIGLFVELLGRECEEVLHIHLG